MPVTIKIYPTIAVERGGDITLRGQVTAPPHLDGEPDEVSIRALTFPQPQGFVPFAAILAAVQARFPNATVEWLTLPSDEA